MRPPAVKPLRSLLIYDQASTKRHWLKEDLVRQQLHCFAAMDDLRGLENAVFSLRRAMHHAWGQPDDDVWSERYNASPVTEKLYRKLVAEVRARLGLPVAEGEAGRPAATGAPPRHR